MRWLFVLLVGALGGLAAAWALAIRDGAAEEPAVLPQSPMPGRLLVGVQDDATFRWAADRAASLDQARDAGVAVIRTTVVWREAAPTRPRRPRNAFDRAYRLDDVD